MDNIGFVFSLVGSILFFRVVYTTLHKKQEFGPWDLVCVAYGMIFCAFGFIIFFWRQIYDLTILLSENFHLIIGFFFILIVTPPIYIKPKLWRTYVGDDECLYFIREKAERGKYEYNWQRVERIFKILWKPVGKQINEDGSNYRFVWWS